MNVVLKPWQLLIAVLAVKGKVLGRKTLESVGALFMPDTSVA
jgi:hypothetical protein